MTLTLPTPEAMAMTVPRARFTVRRMMAAVALSALLLALVRVGAWFAIWIGACVGGSMWQRTRGGRGIAVGAVGGLTCYLLLVAVVYTRAYLYPDPMGVDYLGPALSIGLAVIFGPIHGALVGAGVWALTSVARRMWSGATGRSTAVGGVWPGSGTTGRLPPVPFVPGSRIEDGPWYSRPNSFPWED